MRPSIRAAVVTAGVLAAVGLAAPATAAPPQAGTCSAGLTPADARQLTRVLVGLNPDQPRQQVVADVEAAFATLDANANGYLCYRLIGREGYVNAVDDRA
ncbi:hypothetical protein ACI79J_01815 [Geodermatophilus sp. SYSU D01062]